MSEKDYVEFKVIGEIKTKQRPRAAMIGGHARIYTPKDTLYYENYIKAMYQEKYQDFNFGNKPIALTVKCYFKANQEMAKHTNQTTIMDIPCKTHKDLDNIAKTVMDALNGVAFYDDKQITDLRAFKEYTLDSERLEISIFSTQDEYLYYNLAHYKDKKKLKELIEKTDVLVNKEKINKADSEKIEKNIKQIEELQEKVKDYKNYDK